MAGGERNNSCKLLPCFETSSKYNCKLVKIFELSCLLVFSRATPPQIHRDFRKPLIVMAPKNLLRHKNCKSNLSEFDDVQGHPGFDKQGTRFKRLIKDQNDHSDLEEGIRRLVLCSGKVCSILLSFDLSRFYVALLSHHADTNIFRCNLNNLNTWIMQNMNT